MSRKHPILLLAIAGTLGAGQFKHGLGRGDSIKMKAPALPTVRIGRATLGIDVKDASPPSTVIPGMSLPNTTPQPTTPQPSTNDPSVPTTEIQTALDQVFGENFTLQQTGGEAQLRVAITHHIPAEWRIETITQKMRAPKIGDDGQPVIDPATGQPVMIDRQVAIEQWTARGALAARVEVVDASGALLDGFAPQAALQGKLTVSVDGQDRVDRTQIMTADQLRKKLIADFVAQLVPRYTPAPEIVEIPLAVDEELRPGNKMARDGDFPAAQKAWEPVTLKKADSAGDKLHNLGALYEAQAYGHLIRQADPGNVLPFLAQAAKFYTEAATLDPKEKYITRASERIRKAQFLVSRLKQLEETRQARLAAKTQPSPWPPSQMQVQMSGVMNGMPPAGMPANPVPNNGPFFDPNNPQNQVPPNPQQVQPMPPPVQTQPVPQPTPQTPFAPAPTAPTPTQAPEDPLVKEAIERALNDTRPDTAPEKEFRDLVRLRIRATAGPLPPDQRQQMEAMGPMAYKLSRLESLRVVHQEAKSWDEIQPKVTAYRDSFSAFAQDGKITPQERAALKTLAKNLGVPENLARELETQFKFSE